MLIYLYRIANYLFRHKIPLLPRFIYFVQYLISNSSVPASVSIGKKTKFAYGGIGVVIHSRCVIGNNCIIGQGVTIGGKSKLFDVPKIGNNVYISAGAKLLGPLIVGDNSIIGANAVVISNVPSNSIVAGVPAKVIKSNIDPSDFI